MVAACEAQTVRRIAFVAVLFHPSLWIPAVRQAIRFTPDGWWRRPPFLPLPDRSYWKFRVETVFGASPSPLHVIGAQRLVEYLLWCRMMDRMSTGTLYPRVQ